MPPFNSVEQITPAWLTHILQARGVLRQGRVLSVAAPVEAASPEAGPGFQGRHRLVITYSPDAPATAPRRLYLKAQTGGPHKAAGAREAAFYSAVAARMAPPPGPACFDAAHDPETGAYHLLLEDVAETHRAVYPEEPAAQSDEQQMVEVLAQFHAQWWGRPPLDQPYAAVPTSDEISAEFAQLSAAFPGYVDFLGDRLSPERRRIYEQVLERYPEVLRRRLAQTATLTLVHNDAHAGNFLLPRRPAEARPYLLDWQQWGVHTGLHDVAYLIALFWYPERRARLEQTLVRHYHQRLGAAGFDWPACWWDYRTQAIENLLIPFWAWVYQGAGWGFHRWHQLEKAMLAFEDLHCAECLS